LIETMGSWGQRWVESELSLSNLDASLLMWDMRRNLNPAPLPEQQVVIQFIYTDLPASKRNWWLIVEPGSPVDLCSADPGFDVDLYVSTDLRTMTAIWMGLTTVSKERTHLSLDGDRGLAKTMQTWLGLSPFSAEKKRVA